ncbi:hypothetical protein TcCL_Unassigned04033 [Trypanosoma cruzi]|nr:hypothetical protein TcCL_Unassigned04033 [Trypanosoma cruzi]
MCSHQNPSASQPPFSHLMLDLCAWMTTAHEDRAMCGLGDRTQHGLGNALGLAAGLSLKHGVSMHPFLFVDFPPPPPRTMKGAERNQSRPLTHPQCVKPT